MEAAAAVPGRAVIGVFRKVGIDAWRCMELLPFAERISPAGGIPEAEGAAGCIWRRAEGNGSSGEASAAREGASLAVAAAAAAGVTRLSTLKHRMQWLPESTIQSLPPPSARPLGRKKRTPPPLPPSAVASEEEDAVEEDEGGVQDPF